MEAKWPNLITPDLMYISGSSNYSILNYADGRTVTSGYTMGWWEKNLPTYKRVSRYYLVNPAHIQCYAVVVNGKYMNVSRLQMKRFKGQIIPPTLG